MKKQRMSALSLAMLSGSLLVLNPILQPISQAQRVAAQAQGSTRSIISGRTNSPVLAPSALPDLVAPKGLKIGNGGSLVPWGGSINLSQADRAGLGNGICAFNVGYDLSNVGTVPISVPFKNTLKAGNKAVGIAGVQSLGVGAIRQIAHTSFLPSGTYILSLWLDSGYVVRESNEANNTTYITVNVNCGDLPDISSHKGITFGGNAVTGIGGRFVPWDGSISLSLSDAALPLIPGAAGCPFVIHYDMQNLTTVLTTPSFTNRLSTEDRTVFAKPLMSVPAGGTVNENMKPYLPNGSYNLTLSLDDGHLVNESNEANNLYKVRVKVTCP